MSHGFAMDDVSVADTASTMTDGQHARQAFATFTRVNGDHGKAIVDANTRHVFSNDSDESLPGQIGTPLKAIVGDKWVYAIVEAINTSDTEKGALVLTLSFVGERDKNEPDNPVERGISRFPMPGDSLYATDNQDLSVIYSAAGRPHIRIGTVYPSHTVPANLLTESLYGKHFAILGSTGTGKSSLLALLVHRTVEAMPHGHILILDPHNEYKNAFGAFAVHFDTENLRLPYWLMNMEEMVEILIGRRTIGREVEVDILKRCLLAARKKSLAKGEAERITVDTPVPYRLADLIDEFDKGMGKLEKPESVLPFMRLKNKLEELRSDRRYSFMFSGLLVSDSLSDIVRNLLRMPSNGRPVTTLDLSGVPSDIVDVVVSVLSRLVFDFAVWNKRKDAPPILLVCEEAHRYVPAAGLDQHGSARRVLERIAKEGRKYSVSLGLVTQRASELSEAILSQCGTIISMRMNNERDRRFVESAMPEGSTGFIDSLSSLRNRECIICGEGVTLPVRVGLDTLEEHLRPTSDDPDFSHNWSRDEIDSSYVDQVIRRWRMQDKRISGT